ncbi:MAG: transcription-repair coupling factor, partial [Balneolaceae bacterium]|nr:transcription-repair coupling factor [Balneolaceae bacterium]
MAELTILSHLAEAIGRNTELRNVVKAAAMAVEEAVEKGLAENSPSSPETTPITTSRSTAKSNSKTTAHPPSIKLPSIKLMDGHGSSSVLAWALLQRELTHAPLILIRETEEQAALDASDLVEAGLDWALHFPASGFDPYDLDAIKDTRPMAQRTEVLERLQAWDGKEPMLLCTSIAGFGEQVVVPDSFSSGSLTLRRGETLNPESLEKQLQDLGYQKTPFVDATGDYSRRGGILDIWSISGSYPIRLEFFGDEVESLREFDPDSQRSVAFIDEVKLRPNSSEATGEVAKGTLLEWLPRQTWLAVDQGDVLSDAVTTAWDEAQEAFGELVDKGHEEDIPPPKHWLMSPEDWQTILQTNPLGVQGALSKTLEGRLEKEGRTLHSWTLGTERLPEFQGRMDQVKDWIRAQVAQHQAQITILCDHSSQKRRLEELFEELLDEERVELKFQVASLHEGFILSTDQGTWITLTDHQLFGRYHRAKVRKKRTRGGISLKELRDLHVGDFVVHVDHGIGRFEGFQKIQVRDTVQESAVVRYQGDSLLYVNVTSLHKLQKYSGKEGVEPQMTRLGSGEWARKKEKTRNRVRDIARELIQLYAKRKAMNAYQFSPDNTWQREMEARFEYEETPDQLDTLEAVKHDMESDKPMDRLVCGDVGFGKTEVAIRAAFKAVMDQKQVAVLVPTTILAEQHYRTFERRMADFPVKIGVISRFVPPAEQKERLAQLADGRLDILIGTHRILSKDVQFKDLGLLIVDEEQRFGVAAKDKLKAFRATVDVLTLTATPIPRTLHFSLMGARDLSVIQTPPANRQPVETEIHAFSEALIQEAIMQEVDRGGQVFVIHNRVKHLEEFADMIRGLCPNVRVKMAHGQMGGSELESVIRSFTQHKCDVLVSTNIVENGIDISNANTMIIHQAHTFGLSELHQLRGRVGRSDRKAFCLLLTPPLNDLPSEARRRLMALEEFSDLGSGFHIAMRDLDIRGAGDLLGAEQSGFIQDIGFELYTKILNETVEELKENEFSELFGVKQGNADVDGADVAGEAVSRQEPAGTMDSTTETTQNPWEAGSPVLKALPSVQRLIDTLDPTIEFDPSALLDQEYIQDSVERINLYRSLASSSNLAEMAQWVGSVKDRFGVLPSEA